MKRLALLSTAAVLAVAPALAQQQTPPSQSGQAAPASGSFIGAQTSNQWLATKLIGLTVSGAQQEKIGSVDNLLVDPKGSVVAAVIGVGGLLGIGAKNVAVPFQSLKISRDADGRDKVVLQLSKAELEKAPEFKPYESPRAAAKQPTGPFPTQRKAPGTM